MSQVKHLSSHIIQSNSFAKKSSDNHSGKAASHLSDVHFSETVSFLRSFPLDDHYFRLFSTEGALSIAQTAFFKQ